MIKTSRQKKKQPLQSQGERIRHHHPQSLQM